MDDKEKFSMIDIHTHVLPGIDDGAETVAESLVMLSDSYRQGVRICVATPHCILHEENALSLFCERRQQSHAVLQTGLQKVPDEYPRLLLGAEVYLDHDISDRQSLEELCIEGTRYMLVEFPHHEQDKRTQDWVCALLARGIRPVIAHVDRYPAWQDLMESLAGLKVVYQIGNEPFFSFRGRKLLKDMFLYDETFIAASDMHNCKARACKMASAEKKGRRIFPELTDDLFYKTAKMLLTPAEENESEQ